MEYMPGIILLVIALLFYITIDTLILCHRRKMVQELVWAQLNGKSTKTFFVHFKECSPDQLLFPLTSAQLACIRNCRDFSSTIAEIKGIHPVDALLGRYYFTVHYDICGTDSSGQPFVIREDAYLRVCFEPRGQDILWINGSRKPF